VLHILCLTKFVTLIAVRYPQFFDIGVTDVHCQRCLLASVASAFYEIHSWTTL